MAKYKKPILHTYIYKCAHYQHKTCSVLCVIDFHREIMHDHTGHGEVRMV